MRIRWIIAAVLLLAVCAGAFAEEDVLPYETCTVRNSAREVTFQVPQNCEIEDEDTLGVIFAWMPTIM